MTEQFRPSMEQPEKEGPRQKESLEDFGKNQGEKMAAGLIQSIPGFKVVKEVSKFDDQKSGFDRIGELENGARLAVDVTSTENPKKQEEKINKIFKTRFVQEHDNDGNLINKTKMPLVLFAYNKTGWGEAYNKFLKGEGKSPLDNIDKKNYQLRFLSQAIECLKYQKYYYPRLEEIYNPVLEELKEEYKKLKNER